MNMQSERRSKLIVAGPCSAETEAQVMATAEALAQDERITHFRAGLWKPRSEPGCFEGVGEKGLAWLQRVRRETGLKVATEVATPRHVRMALDAGIDVLWIGARSTTSPFVMQDLSDALSGHQVPVMLKNPVSPDGRLWLGGLKRLQQAGITDITLVHRGFTPHRPIAYRNDPLWELPIEVKAQVPDLKMICDPSHIAGSRVGVPLISRHAWKLGMDGLMIESHIHPDEAWSDARQQLEPSAVLELLDSLEEVEDSPLDSLRSEVDHLDQRLLELIAARMEVVRKIGSEKERMGLEVVQEERWREVMERGRSTGSRLGLSGDFVCKYFHALHQESIDIQQIRNSKVS